MKKELRITDRDCYKAGFSTIEILLAMAISVLTLTAVVLVSFGSQSVAADSQTAAEAQHKAQDLIEQEQALARQDFNQVNNIPSTADGVYHKSVSVTPLDTLNETKQVTATVSWTGDHNRTETSVLSTIVSNPSALTNDDTCSSVLNNDWANPTILNPSHGIDINPDNTTGIAVNNGIVYLTGTHPGNKPNIFAVDVSDPTFPKLLGSLDTGNGLAAVAVSGHYAYAAALTTTGQLQVIDVSDPTFNGSPTVVSRKVAGAGGLGNSIYYYNGKVYLGLTANGSGPQLAIYDVSTPTNPVAMGTYTIGHDVNSIRVKGNYAYIASPSSENLTIIDVNPSSPTYMQRVGGYTAPNAPDSNGAGSNYGESLDVIGSTVYLGRSYGTNEFYNLNAATPASVTVTQSKDIGGGNGTTVYGVIVRSSFAFMTASQQFQVWNLANLGSIYGSLDLSGFNGIPAGGLGCEGNLFYVAVFGPSGGSGHNVLQIVGPGLMTATITNHIYDGGENDVSSVLVGTPVHQAATVTGSSPAPTGTVKYSIYSNSSCTTLFGSPQTVALGTESTPTAPPVGSYWYQTKYNGDTNYVASNSSCLPLVVNKYSPTLATNLSQNSIGVGSLANDTSVLTNATANAGGTVTYTAYTNSTCTTGAQSAGTKTVTNGIVPNSNPVAFNSVGTYYWQAVYSGDANNNTATSPCNSEVLTVTKLNPSITTNLSASSINVTGTANDSATLTGATATAGGTVTYTVYNNNLCTTGATSAGTKTVTNAVVPNSNTLTFNSLGTFYWQAVYSGDANNNGATSACNSEVLTVNKANPTLTTSLFQNSITVGGSANDTSALSGAVASAGGTVTYTAYSNSTCSANPQSAGVKTVTNAVVPNSNPITFNSVGTYYWQAVYSGDANNNGFTSTCSSEVLTVNPPFDYKLTNSAPGGSITVPKNTTGTVIITNTLVSGITQSVTLSESGVPQPSHTTFTFTSNPCSATCTSSLQIATKNSTGSGTFQITVTGAPNGTGPRSTTFSLIVP